MAIRISATGELYDDGMPPGYDPRTSGYGGMPPAGVDPAAARGPDYSAVRQPEMYGPGPASAGGPAGEPAGPGSYNPDPTAVNEMNYQGGFDRFMNSPYMAMASQALSNIGEISAGRRPTGSPFSAMYDVRKQNQLLMDRKYQMVDQQRQWQAAQRLRDAQAKIYEQTYVQNQNNLPNQYSNMPKEYQLWKLSGSKLPLEDFIKQAQSSYGGQLPADVQSYLFAQGLPEDKRAEFMGSRYAPVPVKIGDVTYLVNKGTNQGTAIGPDGMTDFSNINEVINQQAQDKSAAKAEGAVQGHTLGERTAAAPVRDVELNGLITSLESLKKNPALPSIYGAADRFTPTLLPESVNAEADVNSVVARLALDNRAKLVSQGSISDFEGRQLEKSATILSNFGISVDKAQEEIDRVHDILLTAKERNSKLLPKTDETDLGSTDGY